jgi:anti-sigma regulatory factor (Ser/Thr protein kinase)
MTQACLWSYETELEAELVSVLRARRFVCDHLVEHRLLYLVDDVRLVASELVTNAVRYAHMPISVVLGQADRTVWLTVQDDCPVPPVHLAADVMSTAGRGIAIVELVSQNWGVTDGPRGGKSVWASFAMR